MLMNSMSDQCEFPYSKGGKRTIFLANTVPLVKQQSVFLNQQTHLKVGEYYGSRVIDQKLLDTWDKNIWDKELEKHQVLVMSPQILVDLIHHNFIGLILN